MKLSKFAIGVVATTVAAIGTTSAYAAETFHVPGSACLLKRDVYSVSRNVSELEVVSGWAEITCPIPRSTAITRIQVNTSGIVLGDSAIVGCTVGSGSYRRNNSSPNRFVYNGSSLGDVSCMLRDGDKVRSLQVTVR